MAATVVAGSVRRRRRAPIRLLGLGLIAYGVIGLVLLAAVGTALAAPIAEIEGIAGSVEEQRTAALDALERANETIEATADAIGGVDASLAEAKAATDRSAAIALGVATSMSQLADSLTLTIFGVQPLIGLQPGFANSAAQLNLLAIDLATIGTALDANREDALTVARSMGELSTAMGELTEAVRATPPIDDAAASLQSLRLGVLAVLAWLAVLAVGCIGAGFGCWWAAARS